MKSLIPIVIGIVLLLLPKIETVIPEADAVTKACDQYEILFREASRTHADKLDLGSIKTEKESRDFRAAALAEALKQAFSPMAAEEAKVLGEGKWTPEVESKLLRTYCK